MLYPSSTHSLMSCFGCLEGKSAEKKTTNESLAWKLQKDSKSIMVMCIIYLDEVNTETKAFVLYWGNGC